MLYVHVVPASKAMTTLATAPGKVLWAGEYAVLDGAPAVLTAVDRRVSAGLAGRRVPLSPFLRAVLDEVGAAHGAVYAARAARVVVESSALSIDGHKLGLGSSAAATVAATAAALAPLSPPLAEIQRIAHLAHGRAQALRGARGSGADIAAIVHGGALVARRLGDEQQPLEVTPLPLPPSLKMALVWTGVPADTATLVAEVARARAEHPARVTHAIAEITGAALAVRDGFIAEDAAAIVEGIVWGARALAALGTASGAPLVPAIWEEVDTLARRHRGAAKPTGAGGGDLLLAVFAAEGDRQAFQQDAAAKPGMIFVPCDVSRTGVDLQPLRETSNVPGVS